MNELEAVQLCRLAKAASPAQAVDEYTPDLWAMVLGRVRFVDAKAALIELAAEQEWIHLSHIVKRVKRIRRDRIETFGVLPDPPKGCEEPAAYARWIAETRKRIADGETVERPAIAAAPDHAAKRDAIIAGAFRSVPTEQDEASESIRGSERGSAARNEGDA